MWRETDSWFELKMADGSVAYTHLDADGNRIGIFDADGAVLDETNIWYTCVNDNVAAPAWYVPPVVETPAE